MVKADLENARRRFKGEMRTEVFRDSPLDEYLHFLRSQHGDEGSQAADIHDADLHEIFTTEAGLRVLKLFEKAVLHAPQPLGSSEGTLREMNAIRNFVLNIRRIVAHGR